jgi:hypothetical protein
MLGPPPARHPRADRRGPPRAYTSQRLPTRPYPVVPRRRLATSIHNLSTPPASRARGHGGARARASASMARRDLRQIHRGPHPSRARRGTCSDTHAGAPSSAHGEPDQGSDTRPDIRERGPKQCAHGRTKGQTREGRHSGRGPKRRTKGQTRVCDQWCPHLGPRPMPRSDGASRTPQADQG